MSKQKVDAENGASDSDEAASESAEEGRGDEGGEVVAPAVAVKKRKTVKGAAVTKGAAARGGKAKPKLKPKRTADEVEDISRPHAQKKKTKATIKEATEPAAAKQKTKTEPVSDDDQEKEEEALKDAFQPGQNVQLTGTLYSNHAGVVYTRLLRAYAHAEMYFVESRRGAAMVTNAYQMILQPGEKAVSDKVTVETFPDDGVHRIVDCGEDYDFAPGTTARFVTLLERVTIGEYAPYLLGLQSSESQPNTDKFEFEHLRLFMEDDIETLPSTGHYNKGVRVLVRQPSVPDPGQSWIHDVLWHATVVSAHDATVTVQYASGAKVARYGLALVVPKANAVLLKAPQKGAKRRRTSKK